MSGALSILTTGASGDTQAPSVPAGLSASAIGSSSFTLSWTASTDNVGVASYEVFRNGVSVGTTATTSKSITGLTQSTPYSMTVRACDAAGNCSAQSAAIGVTTASSADTTAPSVPAGLSGGSITATGFTLSWAASSDNVGVTGYEVFRNGSSIGTPSGTSLAVTGLAPSTSYSMTVRSRDAAGNWSAQSTASNISTVADTTAPSVPTGVIGSAVTTTSFTLSWTASTDNVGVTGYEVFKDAVSVGTPSGTSLSLTGQAPNTTFAMTVRARDAAGNWSAQSAAVNVKTAIDDTAPSIPTGLASSAITMVSFTLDWTASTDNVSVSNYQVFRNSVSIGTPTGTSIAVSGLSPGTAYSMTVRAVDGSGNWSLESAALVVTTAADVTAPSVPTGLASSAITATSFNLSWTASTDDVAVTGYEVFRDAVSIGLPSGTSLTVSGLTTNTTYAMTVRARDAAGNWSAQSAATNVTTAIVTHTVSAPDINVSTITPTDASGSSTAIVSNGVGPFTHSWAWVSGGAGISLSGQATSTVTANRAGASGSSSGVLRDTVTDTGNGNVTAIDDINVFLEEGA